MSRYIVAFGLFVYAGDWKRREAHRSGFDSRYVRWGGDTLPGPVQSSFYALDRLLGLDDYHHRNSQRTRPRRRHS